MLKNATSRDYNRASVLDAVLYRAPLTRNELIKLTGLSKATVSRAVEDLRADGFVVDGGVDEVARRGRRSTYLDVPGTPGHVVGISFGAQTTGVLVTDLRGRELGQLLVSTAEHLRVGEAAVWLVDLVTEASQTAGPLRQVVVAVPRRVRAGTEIFGPAESLKTCAGSGLQQALADLLDASVLLDSDANAPLGILTEDLALGSAVLFNLSSILNFASCTDHELVRGRGLDLQRIEDLWVRPQVRSRLDATLTAAPEVTAPGARGCRWHAERSTHASRWLGNDCATPSWKSVTKAHTLFKTSPCTAHKVPRTQPPDLGNRKESERNDPISFGGRSCTRRHDTGRMRHERRRQW